MLALLSLGLGLTFNATASAESPTSPTLKENGLVLKCMAKQGAPSIEPLDEKDPDGIYEVWYPGETQSELFYIREVEISDDSAVVALASQPDQDFDSEIVIEFSRNGSQLVFEHSERPAAIAEDSCFL